MSGIPLEERQRDARKIQEQRTKLRERIELARDEKHRQWKQNVIAAAIIAAVSLVLLLSQGMFKFDILGIEFKGISFMVIPE